MFSSHKPRVYRCTTGCCICGSKSSSSRFTSSEKYESLFTSCFDVAQGSRSGVLCNACVLLVKRWQKLPEDAKRTWAHVVDGKIGRRRNSRRASSIDEEPAEMQAPQTLTEENCQLETLAKPPSSNQGDISTNLGREPRLSDGTSPPSYSPTLSEISDCAISDNGRISTACQTSFFFPQLEESEMKFPYVDLSGWHREEVCCGTIFKGPCGEVLVDPKLLKPSCHCARRPSQAEANQGPQET